MNDFNLRQLIRDTADQSGVADPDGLTKEVAAQIPDDQVREALEQTLRSFVHAVIVQMRMFTGPDTGEESTATPNRRSWKRDGARSHWHRQLRDRIHVGKGEWRFLADCTVQDLLFAAAERRAHAEQNLQVAVRFEELAELVRTRGVLMVKELPENDLEAAA